MANLGRLPVTLVEIDLPYCSRTYGAAPCAAALGLTGAAKCFNSRFTCQDTSHFLAGTKTVTFSMNQDGLPDIPGLFPALKSVTTRPGELNLSGLNPRTGAFGARARVTVTLEDFTNNDTWLDAYQAQRRSGAALASGIGYDPASRGQFLARMFARWPYYVGLPLRVRRGYAGQAPADMPTEHYVISELRGPTAAGLVTITAKDVFDLADDEKAVYPQASRGKLKAELDEIATTANLTPDGIGNAEYPASGLVRIGREIMGFSRSGDVLTLTREQEGTVASKHSALDVVQVCGVIDNVTLNVAIETILKDHDTGFDAFIDSAEWQAEHDTWLAGLKTGRVVISKPTGKTSLIGEILQLGVMVWWDPVGQKCMFKANAPLLPDETYYEITDRDAIIAGTPEIDMADDQRASAIWIYHGVRDWTDEPRTARNFNNLVIATVGENLYGQAAYKEIYTRWFGRVGNDGSASIIAERLLARYRETPRVVSATLDVKDRAGVSLASRLLVESYVLQDVDGSTVATPMQVNFVEYTGDDRVRFRAETYKFDGRFGFFMDDGTAPADYDSATEAQKDFGAFWGDDTQSSFPDGRPFYQWF